MTGMGLLPVHQGQAIEPGRQGSGGEGIAAVEVHPVVQGLYVEIRPRGQMEGLGGSAAAPPTLQLPLLPMQKDLIIFENRVVAQVLEPQRPQPQQAARPGGAELEGEAGKQPAFAPADRRGIDDGENAAQAGGRQVVPHQGRGDKGGVLAAETPLPGALFPEHRETLRPARAQLGPHRCRIAALPDGAVVGEIDVADVEHVLQQGECVHRQVTEGVLQQPRPIALVVDHRHGGQGNGGGGRGVARENEQQALGFGGGKAAAGGTPLGGAAARFGLGNAAAEAVAIETPAVVGAFELTILIDAPFREGHQPMGAEIREGPPTA